MRQDKVIFSGENPFLEFAKCRELTVLLSDNKFIFVASHNSINIMVTFNSTVRVFEEEEKIREAYTIPLSLVLPLFKLDANKVDNTLTLETTSNKVKITYNKASVDTDIYSPNGLTIQQISQLNTKDATVVDPSPFIQISDLFGVAKDNFCNVDGKILYISDGSKCLIHQGEFEYPLKFALPIQFIRLMKTMNCVKMYIGTSSVIAETKSGLWLITNLSKLTDTHSLMDFKFASKLKSDEVYTLSINKYLKTISLAVQSSELSARLNLSRRQLILESINNEQSIIQLSDLEVRKEGEFDFFAQPASGSSMLELNDARLIRSLASFGKVKIKVCPQFLLAKLGKNHRLMFTLGRN